MASETFYAEFDRLDAVFRQATDAALQAGLVEMRSILPMALVPLIIACGVLIATGSLGMGRVTQIGGRVCIVIWLILGTAYMPIIHDTFITDISNMFATAVNGGGERISIVQQFDRVETAANSMAADALKQSTGIMQTGNRVAIWIAVTFQKVCVGLLFIVFVITRIILYICVAIGAWLLVFLLFDSTKQWPLNMLGKLISLSIFQLGLSIILKIVLASMSSFIVRSGANAGGVDIDEQINQLFNVALLDLGCLALALALPAVASVGCGSVAGAALQSAFAGGNVMARAAGAMNRAASTMRRR